jgi:hypothetical protein
MKAAPQLIRKRALVLRSRYGLALSVMRDSEATAESAGVDSFRTKLGVYVLVAAATGTIGALISGRFAPGKQIAVDCFQMGAHRKRCCLGVAPQQSGDQRAVLLAVCVPAFGAE